MLPAGAEPSCADPEVLPLIDEAFKRPGGPAAHRLAAVVCPHCPVAAACLAIAVENGEHGPWGGTSRKLRSAFTGHKGQTFNMRAVPVSPRGVR
jgi:hypothetical protein